MDEQTVSNLELVTAHFKNTNVPDEVVRSVEAAWERHGVPNLDSVRRQDEILNVYCKGLTQKTVHESKTKEWEDTSAWPALRLSDWLASQPLYMPQWGESIVRCESLFRAIIVAHKMDTTEFPGMTRYGLFKRACHMYKYEALMKRVVTMSLDVRAATRYLDQDQRREFKIVGPAGSVAVLNSLYESLAVEGRSNATLEESMRESGWNHQRYENASVVELSSASEEFQIAQRRGYVPFYMTDAFNPALELLRERIARFVGGVHGRF